MCQRYVAVKEGTDINKTLNIRFLVIDLDSAVLNLLFQAPYSWRQHTG